MGEIQEELDKQESIAAFVKGNLSFKIIKGIQGE